MTALLASPYGTPALMLAALAAVTAGVALGATWDHLAAWLNPNGAHRR